MIKADGSCILALPYELVLCSKMPEQFPVVRPKYIHPPILFLAFYFPIEEGNAYHCSEV